VKSILRGIALNSFALWITSQLVNGLSIKGGVDVILLGGLVLTLMNLLVKPVLSILTLPFNPLTMGLFSWVLNVVIIYLLTVVVSQISITTYTFPGINLNGFALPQMNLSSFQTAILVAFIISAVTNIFLWLFRR
jgi:putative membrane protein